MLAAPVLAQPGKACMPPSDSLKVWDEILVESLDVMETVLYAVQSDSPLERPLRHNVEQANNLRDSWTLLIPLVEIAETTSDDRTYQVALDALYPRLLRDIEPFEVPARVLHPYPDGPYRRLWDYKYEIDYILSAYSRLYYEAWTECFNLKPWE